MIFWFKMNDWTSVLYSYLGDLVFVLSSISELFSHPHFSSLCPYANRSTWPRSCIFLSRINAAQIECLLENTVKLLLLGTSIVYPPSLWSMTHFKHFIRRLFPNAQMSCLSFSNSWKQWDENLTCSDIMLATHQWVSEVPISWRRSHSALKMNNLHSSSKDTFLYQLFKPAGRYGFLDLTFNFLRL